MKKRILLLGATGSIGLQTIDVIDQHSDLFELVGIAAGHKAKELKQILDTHNTIRQLEFQMFQKLKSLTLLRYIVVKMPCVR